MPSNEMPGAKFLEEFALIVALPEKVKRFIIRSN
jgi:hypothetical protein